MFWVKQVSSKTNHNPIICRFKNINYLKFAILIIIFYDFTSKYEVPI